MKCIQCGNEDIKLDHEFEHRNPGTGEMEKIVVLTCARGHFFPSHDPAVIEQMEKSTEH